MDTRTGEIHDLQAGETVDDLARRLGVAPGLLVPVAARPARPPAPICTKCQGKGAVRAGLNSKRFKPCICVCIAKKSR